MISIATICSCSKDDNTSPISKPFLELYTGTTWVRDHGKDTTYIRFINNESKLLEKWIFHFDEPDCYYFTDDVYGNEILQIIENTEDKLIFKVTYHDAASKTITITMQGEILKILDIFKEVGEDDQERIFYYTKTSINVDGFTLCPA